MKDLIFSTVCRMFAGDNVNVAENDIVMTVDVNLFVMTPEIITPILARPGLVAWVPQYSDTADISSGRGETFNQNLVALRAADWRRVTGYKGSIEDLVRYYREEVELLDDRNTWYTDQLITQVTLEMMTSSDRLLCRTHSLLSSKTCSVPESSGLWNLPGLEFDPEFDDSGSCWHGRGFKDCNKDIHIVYQGCKWWHFYPDQRFQDHLDKFYELTNNSIPLDFEILTK